MGPIMFAVCVALQVSFLRKFYPPRCISSEPSIDSEGGQDEDQCVDDGPDEGDPGRHLKVSCLIHTSEPNYSQQSFHYIQPNRYHSQSSHNSPSNKCLNAPYQTVQRQRNPYQLPVPPLHYARP
jgi:hypothetical protein